MLQKLQVNNKKSLRKEKSSTIRADKLLSSLGLTSRRGVEEFLIKNTVEVNGKKIIERGQRLPINAQIKINGKVIVKPKKIYFLLNKPKGVISTSSDEFGRRNVVDLINSQERVFSVGRLDRDTHGILILTNDGELTNKLIHPKYHIGKTYLLKIKGIPKNKQIRQLESGVELEDGLTAPAKARIIPKSGDGTFIELQIFEGKKRQIRRMCKAVGLKLLDLQRIKFGNLTMGDLKIGEYRELTNKEIEKLKKLTEKPQHSQ